jgi:ribosomal RNA-processing protein 8
VAKLAQYIQVVDKNKRLEMKSFDLKAANERVIECDIANLPLPDSSADIAIFCLALMGTDFMLFIQEAARVLKKDGKLWIAEIKSRFSDRQGTEFIDALKKVGFDIERREDGNKMFIMFDFTLRKRMRGEVEVSDKIGGILKPCTYKKR